MTVTCMRSESQLPMLPDSSRCFPDPMLSANVYCSGRLSEVMNQVVAPFWREIHQQDELGQTYLWLMRYAKCGDHLKIRIHGPDSRGGSLRHLLSSRLEAYFQRLPPSNEEQKFRDLATPIDREDRGTTNHPDRTVLWTHYERSHISFGYEPFLSDEAYLALSSRCMGSATAVILNRLEVDATGRCPHPKLQMILINALIAGLSALPFSAEDRSTYLRYHRDWLLRDALKQGGTLAGPAKMEETLAVFQRQIDKLGPAVARLSATAQERWKTSEEDDWAADLFAWRQSLADLLRHVLPLCDRPTHQIDPFADIPSFAPLFKVFHNAANQLGLTHLNEAFAYHLLLQATATPDQYRTPVRLLPWMREAR